LVGYDVSDDFAGGFDSVGLLLGAEAAGSSFSGPGADDGSVGFSSAAELFF
jgi:hypothetical protein